MVVVSNNNLKKNREIPLITSNSVYSNDYIDNGNWNNGGQIQLDIERPSPCRVKYHASYSQNRWMVVEGRLGNGRKYPVVLDTGASPTLFVNDIHIRENNLAVRPLGTKRDSFGWGVCHLPKLSIGQLTLLDWPCFYREQHTELQVLGVPIAKGKAIIAGLPAMRRFKYIAFDSNAKEVEFSLQKPFFSTESDSWAIYPFMIEEGLGGNAFLYVTIPIAGKDTELQLDTGSGRGLAISEILWEQLRKRIPNVRLSTAKDLYPYIGWLPCRRGVIEKVEVGNRTVNSAKISVFPNNSPLLDRVEGLLGMQYFQDTVMVLDFERNLMWVKNPQS
jgi:hypothetical protein